MDDSDQPELALLPRGAVVMIWIAFLLGLWAGGMLMTFFFLWAWWTGKIKFGADDIEGPTK